MIEIDLWNGNLGENCKKLSDPGWEITAKKEIDASEIIKGMKGCGTMENTENTLVQSEISEDIEEGDKRDKRGVKDGYHRLVDYNTCRRYRVLVKDGIAIQCEYRDEASNTLKEQYAYILVKGENVWVPALGFIRWTRLKDMMSQGTVVIRDIKQPKKTSNYVKQYWERNVLKRERRNRLKGAVTRAIEKRKEEEAKREQERRNLFEIMQKRVCKAFDIYCRFVEAEVTRMKFEQGEKYEFCIIRADETEIIKKAYEVWKREVVDMINAVYGYEPAFITDEILLTTDGIPDDDFCNESYDFIKAKLESEGF